MGRRSELTAAQRTELVLQLLRREETGKQLARRAGISEQTLCRWRDDFIRAGQGAMNGRDGQSGMQAVLKRKEKQLTERDQMIGELTVTNRIQKKTSQYSLRPMSSAG